MPVNLARQKTRPPDYHLPCPRCGPACQTAANGARKVVGVWEDGTGRRRTWCIRCGAKDRDHAGSADFRPLPPQTQTKKDTSQTAQWLWAQSRPLAGTPGETYLRIHRGLDLASLPATLRFLTARNEHSAALIGAFGRADGTEPSDLELEGEVTAIHLTRLDETGAKLGKIMLGTVAGQPLCLAPLNDTGGLAITEGIEDALSVHLATGLGAWAAGSAAHMPKLAGAVSPHTRCVTILADPDLAGRRGAGALDSGLKALGFEARLLCLAERL